MSQLPARAPDPNLIVGLETSDDAGVYRLSDELALVQTIDFFTPIVDDPYAYGWIAAANALSDVYAMGGTPLTAMNVVGFPIDKLDRAWLAAILQGGADAVREAGAALVGGHSVDDVEPKYGLSVTGLIDPRCIWTNAGATAECALILTKPIGMGVVTKAIKDGCASEPDVRAAIRWMKELNRSAAEVGRRFVVHAATDVTGFGLLGHAAEIVAASGVSVTIYANQVPLLPGAREYAADGHVPAGSRRNRAFVEPITLFADDVDELDRVLLCDAVTSGGLLFAVSVAQAQQLVAQLQEVGLVHAAVIGHFETRREPLLQVLAKPQEAM